MRFFISLVLLLLALTACGGGGPQLFDTPVPLATPVEVGGGGVLPGPTPAPRGNTGTTGNIGVSTNYGADVTVVSGATVTGTRRVSSGAVDFAVQDVSLTQGVADEPLVVGKATDAVLRVALAANTNAEALVSVDVNGRVYSQTVQIIGPESSVIMRVDPPARVQDVSVRGAVQAGRGLSDADASNNSKNAAYPTVQTGERVAAFFLPVDWTAQDMSKVGFETAYKRFVQDNADFIGGAYPLARDQLTVDYSLTPHMLTTFEKTLADSSGQFSQRNALTLYASISIAGRRYRPDATIVVGVMPPAWFRNHGQPGTLGLTLREVKGTVTGEYDPTDPTTAAHEVGHLYWLYEDYDYAVKPARPGVEITRPEVWVQRSRQLITSSGKRLWTYLSSGSSNIIYWTDQRIYEYLLAKFASNGGTASQPLIVNATMAWEVEKEGYPSDYSAGIRRFEPDQIAYCTVAGMALQANSKIEARWYRGDSVVNRETKTARTGNGWYAFSYGKDGSTLAEDPNYRVEIYLDGKLVKTTRFEVKKGL